MVVLNRIYTRKGDDGTTRLTDGAKRLKSDLRIEAYGTVDETNACIGMTRIHTGASHPHVDAMLARIQNDLFDLGADLSTPHEAEMKWEPLRIVEAQVDRLEKEIDALNDHLAPLNSFILPGGSPAAAHLHLARTVCRRAERVIVALMQDDAETVSPAALKYINRLSDFLFVVSRTVNNNGADYVLWVPGKNR
ncbi:MAG: cob(I)yrinic acid a,c-diamide adenosyltransferase [Beijerinckiaceae bacterium]